MRRRKEEMREERLIHYGAFVCILGFVANSNIETAQIRAFLVATEKDVLTRVSMARAGMDTAWMDSMEFARRNFDAAQGKTVEVAGHVRQAWQESSEKVAQAVQAAWEKAKDRYK